MFASHLTFTAGMGILGNTVALMVYLSPLPTFIRIYKKQSTEEFESVPYVVGLLSAMLWLYYALLQGDDLFLMSINVVGCVIQTLYIALYFAYAPINSKICTAKLVSLILVVFSSIYGVFRGLKISASKRLKVLGIICVVFSITVFIAPLTIMVKVVQTKSLRFMPFPLSFFLTLNAIIWFYYGLLRKDGFIWVELQKVGISQGLSSASLEPGVSSATTSLSFETGLPNIVGFILGLLQIATYGVCKYSFTKQQQQQDKTTTKLPPPPPPPTSSTTPHKLQVVAVQLHHHHHQLHHPSQGI